MLLSTKYSEKDALIFTEFTKELVIKFGYIMFWEMHTSALLLFMYIICTCKIN